MSKEFLSVNNYKKSISKAILGKAAKCTVRECDEIEKNQFQAYVDAGKETFDVILTLNPDLEVSHHQCDCGQKSNFCEHKTAVLNFLANNTKNKKTSAKTTKADPLELLLAEVDTAALKAWVKTLLNKNKELELSFMHQFSTAQKPSTPEAIAQATLQVIKAVIGKRSKAETAETKKIVELWTEIHEEIVRAYYKDAANEDKFQLFIAVLNAIGHASKHLHTNSGRIPKYKLTLISGLADPVSQLESETEWDKIIQLIIDQISIFRLIQVEFLTLLSEILGKSSQPRREKVIALLAAHYTKFKKADNYETDMYTKIFFNIIIASDTFEKYFTLFHPIQWQIAYNEALIEELMAIGQYNIAEKFSLEQIASNVKKEYNLPYLNFLKEIYTQQQRNTELAKVLAELLPDSYDINDYLFVMKYTQNPAVQKYWRTKAITSAKHASKYHRNAHSFLFQLFDAEQNYKKMIILIEDHTTYELIVRYAEKMILTNKYDFVSALFRRNDAYDYDDNMRKIQLSQLDISRLHELNDLIKRYYTEYEIREIAKKVRSYTYSNRTNFLLDYIRKGETAG
ncbi:hypothetical protein [Chitinophaga sp. sic0106]|uniref:hypothetical protein n=1 Tax=Chitinophaga sp. sic0106 TaxID=2854785 RepID=UPI001C4368D0|nr:hypothetical protein [Chitinophaga sp. sic0106]MBV7533726.1 hypothetical protein [Chitinophaga sp. sic0106]